MLDKNSCIPNINVNKLTSTSELLKRTIIDASCDNRLVLGTNNSIDYLNTCDPFKVLAVVLTDSSDDLVSQTILETYCYEQKIPFLKTDLKLVIKILKFAQNFEPNSDLDCVLIMKPQEDHLKAYEIDLINFISQYQTNDETLILPNSSLPSPATPTQQINWPQMSHNKT